ncbi:tellurite resistance TerB family protein [Xanthomonas hyacinthi]|uniref:DUF533 domain-containing protein n=1 Tax=Xanthomonas hyacinthi TaxID=56455 RepID=A0A2S7ER21_9XANT|nr:tellurite resistance TerB family protein [Xanthomonas hyacinthi]KLD77475.1 hypothetical protein Y886_15595 [Xanthomonas hyacinthi DSM 19077]PPU95565.1 DUF533 domain-containing protein [Xanthomonas hyacinthi]QGY75642.1 tellurite resistance TerB family protein [Xanthomonas hyacinthi]
MKLQGFLDQLLQSAQGAAGQAMAKTGTSASAGTASKSGGLGGMLNADFGKGLLSGGTLGLLLGKNRTTRKLASYGSLAALGVLAYRAYGDYKRQQLGAAAPEPQTLDRLPPLDVEQHSQAILRALIAAAKADGHIDSRERELIEGQFTRLDGDADVQRWLHAELEKPLDPAEVAQAATTREIASEMYLASLLAADAQSCMERSYLDELARQLGIDDGLKQHLQRQAAAQAH